MSLTGFARRRRKIAREAEEKAKKEAEAAKKVEESKPKRGRPKKVTEDADD
jgi:hypothetical protein